MGEAGMYCVLPVVKTLLITGRKETNAKSETRKMLYIHPYTGVGDLRSGYCFGSDVTFCYKYNLDST
jgi:hypothetical protein